MPTVRHLWADEDHGAYPTSGPLPTVKIHSSKEHRHLYWRLTHAVAVEWALEMNERIAVWSGADEGIAKKITSVLRPPGCANYKRHPHVDVVHGELTGVPAWEPETLDQAVPLLPEPEPTSSRGNYDGPDVPLAPYLRVVEVIREVPDSHGAKWQIVCPWLGEHSLGDRSGTYIGRMASGATWFSCSHAHCQGRGWREFKSTVRPVYRRPRHTDKAGYTGPKVREFYRG
jgi:hypothetical protein